MQVINRPLRMGGSGKDCALVIAQHLKPRTDIGGMIIAIFQLQFQISTQKRCT